MKCPKCGYLGFETTERCRHCGYDFSLPTHVATSLELPLRGAQTEAPFADFDLSRVGSAHDADSDIALDLNRVIGDVEPAASPASMAPAASVAMPPTRPPQHRAAALVADEDGLSSSALPLFTQPGSEGEEPPPVAPPR